MACHISHTSDWHVALVQSSMTSRSSSRTSESHHPVVQADQWIFFGIFKFYAMKKTGHSVSCVTDICLPKGRHSEAAHEKRLLCARKCTRGWGGVGHVGVGWGGSCRGGVGWGVVGDHVEVGWGGVCHVGVWWGVSCRDGVGWVM